MIVKAEHVGRVYPPTEPYEVSREKIREFADAINDPNPAYRVKAAARALGYEDIIAPPTFAILLTLKASTQVIADPDFNIDYSRVVHGEQQFSIVRPIVAGDILQVQVTVEAVHAVGGNDIVTTREDVTSLQGEPVLTTRTTIVTRGTAT